MPKINEISKETLASYKSKANVDFEKASKQDDTKRMYRRGKGLLRATGKQMDISHQEYMKKKKQYEQKETTMNILESIQSMIDEIEAGNNFDAEKIFNQIMMTKIDNALSAKKIEVANSMFNTQECADCEEVEEELKGDQHKIDANKNGKLDAHDFKMLRKKKKGMSEAVVSAAKKPMDAAAAKAAYQAEKKRREMQQANKPAQKAVAPKPKAKKVLSPEAQKAKELAMADMRASRKG